MTAPDIEQLDTLDPAPRKRRAPSSRARRSKATTDQALSTMDTLYAGAAAALLALGKVDAASLVATQSADLHESNARAFDASPALARTIASLGQVSGIGIFVGSHLMLVFSVTASLRRKPDTENSETVPE